MNRRETNKSEHFSITDLAQEFGISTRAIRFYESRGLIAPGRIGSTRVFCSRDRVRLILILRGKRLGFSLKDISDYLDLYDIDPDEAMPTEHLDQRVGERIDILERQQADLETTLRELRSIKKRTEEALMRK